MPDESRMPEADLSFADGPNLVAATGVRFRNELDDVYDWQLGEQAETKISFVNPVSRCEVLDQRDVFTGAEIDDETATLAVVAAMVEGREVVHPPHRSIWGIDEGLGEGGLTYDVIQARFRSDDRVTFVTARVFTALGVQHHITVTCDDFDGLGLTGGQLVQKAYMNIDGTAEF